MDLPALERDLRRHTDGEVRFDRVSRALYSTDASVYQIEPAGVVVPRSRDDVVRIVEIARRHGASITARGGGTSQGPTLSFAKSTDFPPKKVTIEHVRLIVSWADLTAVSRARVCVFERPVDVSPPPAFTGSSPRPLRAPPAVRLS